MTGEESTSVLSEDFYCIQEIQRTKLSTIYNEVIGIIIIHD